MVDADADATCYAYGPSIIKKDGVYHVFFCSAGPDSTWDAVRYVHSTDGKTWSAPTIMLRASGANGADLAACDPSVVYYQGFYYMYYSSAYSTAPPNSFQTVIQVARALNIDGPYLTYTQRGTWEETPTDAQIIIKPLVTRTVGYGAGPEAVVVHKGEILLWYVDDSLDPNAGVKPFMLKSTNPVSWAPSASNGISIPSNTFSFDVKFNPTKNQFIMTNLVHTHAANAYLARSFSGDGRYWNTLTTIIDVGAFPDYANNVGAAGDETGNTLPASALVAFGAPYDLNGFNVWGQWDLYGVMVDGP